MNAVPGRSEELSVLMQAASANIEMYLETVKKASEAAVPISFHCSLDFHYGRAQQESRLISLLSN